MSNNINLLSMFEAVTSSLSENKESLNKADTHNGDHGDNMVNIFSMVTDAFGQKESGSLTDQLALAGKLLGKEKSGSAQVYSKGFEAASDQFKEQPLGADNFLDLVQTLMGGGEVKKTDDNMAGMLTGFLGGSDGKIDAGDILKAGLAFFSAKNQGGSTSEALIQAVISSSPMGASEHRSQSSSIVAGTMLDLLGGFLK